MPSPPRGGPQTAADGIPEYVIVKNKGRTHRSKLRPGDECELKDGSWAIYRPDLMNGGSVHVKGKGWIPEGELKPGDQYECNGVWVTYQPERVINSTEEHPFYIWGKGWTPLREIRPGDLLRTEDGWVPVKSIENTGRYEPVYNLRVEDYHTYFVGARDWGFAVWAHNNGGCVHRVGGGEESNLGLKLAEAKLDPPGISVLIGGTPADTAAAFRRVFGPKSSLGKAARTVGTAEIKQIRAAGFDVVPVPTTNFPNHGRIVHPTEGAAGFTPANLQKLSGVFTNTTGL